MSLDALEAANCVSADELHRWHERGWLSFDPFKIERIDWGEEIEVRFVSDLARTSLSDAWIGKLLTSLPKPYCYSPDATFFSFSAKQWVTLPNKLDQAELTEECLAELAQNDDWDTLEWIRDRADELLEEKPDDESGASE